MNQTVSLYAFEPGTPDVPAASATGVFVRGLVSLLRETPLDLHLRPLRSAEIDGGTGDGLREDLREAVTGLSWAMREVRRLLADPSRYLIFIYPKVPVLSHVTDPTLLWLAAGGYRLLRGRTRLTGQRIVVIVEDLPIEMAHGRAAAGGPAPALPEDRIRSIERTLFRSADRVVVPSGFVSTIRDLHGVDPARFRIFHRNIYRIDGAPGRDASGAPERPEPPEPPEPPAELGFERGDVNFFYSGTLDASTAPNFRAVLRSVRQASGARLHVCGPGGDAAREWFDELEVRNARHYGRLEPEVHDAVASRCDVGLILYPTDNPYNHLTPTMKYTAYVANGLAVLSTDLRGVSENLRRDGTGRALPIKELSVEVLRWATRSKLFAEFRDRARALAGEVRSGAEMRSWIEEIVRGE